MRWLSSLRSLWHTLVQSSRLDRDLDDELRAYVEPLASTLVILTLVAVAALWLPAHRASRVDLSTVLRE